MSELLYIAVTNSEGQYDYWDIFRAQPFGSSPTRLTSSQPGALFDNQGPVLSPDRTWIAFTSTRVNPGSRVAELYLMRPDGTDVQRVGGGIVAADPRWLDGATIMFSSGGAIAEIKVDGSSFIARTEGFDDGFVGCSRDGTRIVFVRDFGAGTRQIISANRDGSDQRVLSGTADTLNESPHWSPDGTRIAFASSRDNSERGVRDIYVMNCVDTSGDQIGDDLTRLTFSSEGNGCTSPVWSPEGSQIAFARHQDGTGRICIIDASGGTAQVISNIPDPKVVPYDWQ